MSLLLIGLLILTSRVAPIIPPPPDLDPYPYSLTNTSKEQYPKTTAGAQRFISDSRPPRWNGQHNTYVQAPIESASKLSGDCDDFAVMMAYYLEEYWWYDTFVVMLDMGSGLDDHAVAFVYDSDALLDFSYCGSYPVIERDGKYYEPVDWSRCPDWHWAKHGGTVNFRYDWTYYNYVRGQWGYAWEWEWLVGLQLSIPPSKPVSGSCKDVLERPVAVFDQGRP